MIPDGEYDSLFILRMTKDFYEALYVEIHTCAQCRDQMFGDGKQGQRDEVCWSHSSVTALSHQGALWDKHYRGVLACGGEHFDNVIVRSVFPQEDPLVLNEYRDDLRSECEKFGEVKKVIIFDVSVVRVIPAEHCFC